MTNVITAQLYKYLQPYKGTYKQYIQIVDNHNKKETVVQEVNDITSKRVKSKNEYTFMIIHFSKICFSLKNVSKLFYFFTKLSKNFLS